MKNPLAIVLVVVGVGMAIYGITVFGDSGESTNILGLDLTVKDNDMRIQSFMFIALGLVAILGGLYVMKKKR